MGIRILIVRVRIGVGSEAKEKGSIREKELWVERTAEKRQKELAGSPMNELCRYKLRILNHLK